MNQNPHFEAADSWKSAKKLVMFTPVEPKDTLGHPLQYIRIHVRDHKLRQLSLQDRTLEAYYGSFVFTEAWKGEDEARRCALAVSYGQDSRDVQIAGHSGRVYELGPEPPPDDIDGRTPSVVVWHDREMFYLIASIQLHSEELVQVAVSVYEQGSGRRSSSRRPG